MVYIADTSIIRTSLYYEHEPIEYFTGGTHGPGSEGTECSNVAEGGCYNRFV